MKGFKHNEVDPHSSLARTPTGAWLVSALARGRQRIGVSSTSPGRDLRDRIWDVMHTWRRGTGWILKNRIEVRMFLPRRDVPGVAAKRQSLL